MLVKKNIYSRTFIMCSLITLLFDSKTIATTNTNTTNNSQNQGGVQNGSTANGTGNSRTDNPSSNTEPMTQCGLQAVNDSSSSNKMPDWLVQASLKNAPPLVKGILNYLTTYNKYTIVPSFHRIIFVGKPGTGKTTLAFALARALKYEVRFAPAASFMGAYRNQTAVRIRNFFENLMAEKPSQKVIIIDELHKLFEHHADEKSDNSESAAAFWLMLDRLERTHPHIVVIGTANSVDKLPPEIKSRFHGKIITIPLPHKNQKLQAFRNILNNDFNIILDRSIDERFIQTISKKLQNCSLRDVQLLVDTAKMFKYAEGKAACGTIILLEKRHFEQAFKQLNSETEDGEKSLYERALPNLKEISFCLSLCLNMAHLSYYLKPAARSTTG